MAKKIVVADDERHIVLMVQVTLERYGYDSQWQISAEEIMTEGWTAGSLPARILRWRWLCSHSCHAGATIKGGKRRFCCNQVRRCWFAGVNAPIALI